MHENMYVTYVSQVLVVRFFNRLCSVIEKSFCGEFIFLFQ